jgi:transposase
VDSLSTTELIANPEISEWKTLSQHNETGHGPVSESGLGLKGTEVFGAPTLASLHGVPPSGTIIADPEAGEGRGKLGPHLKLLQRMVEEQPRAKIKDFYLALRERGYYGSYDLVKKKIHSFRRELGKQAGSVFTSHDAPYAQVELAKVALKGPGREVKAHLFTMILGHSGRYYSELIESCDMGSFLQCHQNAFDFFGGVPAGVFYDPHESPAMRRLVGGYPFHLPIVDCGMHYGYIAQATPAFAPWMKGRLKRPGKILKKLFFPGHEFASLEAANTAMQEWVELLSRQNQIRERKDKLQREKMGALPGCGFNFRGRRQFLRLRA